MTYKEMVRHLLETYPPGDYTGDELRDYIAAEINAVEARGGITTEVRHTLYRAPLHQHQRPRHAAAGGSGGSGRAPRACAHEMQPGMKSPAGINRRGG
jgi:hypothetical protein